MTFEETIDAFIDGETVDTAALDAALATPSARTYLFDALALRRLMADEAIAMGTRAPRGRRLHFYAQAAAAAIVLVGLGYAAGARDRAPDAPEPATAQTSDAPAPTRVIEVKQWHESRGGD